MSRNGARVRPPAKRSWGRQQEVLEARSAVEPVPTSRSRLHPRRLAELPGAAGLGYRRRPRRVQPRRDGRRVRHLDVNSNPARFDQKKADAINAEHLRLLSEEDFIARLAAYFAAHNHETGLDDAQFADAARLVQTRIVVLGDAWDLLKFLNDAEFALDEKSAAKELRAEAVPVLDAALGALEDVAEWTTEQIETALKDSLLEKLELKPRKAFGPIRVAATGATVSPPLFESLELLGRDRSLRRLRAGRDHAAADAAEA